MFRLEKVGLSNISQIMKDGMSLLSRVLTRDESQSVSTNRCINGNLSFKNLENFLDFIRSLDKILPKAVKIEWFIFSGYLRW